MKTFEEYLEEAMEMEPEDFEEYPSSPRYGEDDAPIYDYITEARERY